MGEVSVAVVEFHFFVRSLRGVEASGGLGFSS